MLAQNRVAAVYLDLGKVTEGVSNIVIDYENGIVQALEHLASLGHSRIAYVGGPPNIVSAQRRKNAFVSTAERLSLHDIEAIAAAVLDSLQDQRGGMRQFGGIAHSPI